MLGSINSFTRLRNIVSPKYLCPEKKGNGGGDGASGPASVGAMVAVILSPSTDATPLRKDDEFQVLDTGATQHIPSNIRVLLIVYFIF